MTTHDAATIETAREINAESISILHNEVIRLRSDKLLLRRLAAAERETILAIASWMWMDADELVVFTDDEYRRLDSLLENGADFGAWIGHVIDGGSLRYRCLFCRDVDCGADGVPVCQRVVDPDEVMKRRMPKRVAVAREKLMTARKLAEGMEE